MKRTKRMLCLLLTVWMLFPLAIGCEKKEEESVLTSTWDSEINADTGTDTATQEAPEAASPPAEPEASAPATPSTESEPSAEPESSTVSGVPPKVDQGEKVVLVSGGKANCVIAYTDDSYADIAKALADGLREKTTVSFSCMRADAVAADTVTLFVGSDYNAIAEDGRRLMEEGYAIVESGGDFHLCGKQVTLLETAVEKFLDMIVSWHHIFKDENGKVVYSALPSTFSFFYHPRYPIADPTLLSAHLFDYRIVVSEASGTIGLQQGTLLADWFRAHTGFSVEVVTDAATPTEREIVVGSTSRKAVQPLAANEWSMAGEGTRLYINCGSSYAFDGAYAKLKEIFADPNTVNLSGTTESYAKSSSDIRILTYNVWTGTPTGFTQQDKYQSIADLIYTLRPDFIGLQEARNWRSGVAGLIAEDYGMISAVSNGHLPIFYDKTIWRPATDGSGAVIQNSVVFTPSNMWSCHWVMFERIDDPSEKVIFGNLHFCNTNEDPANFYRQYRPEQMRLFNAEIKRLETEYAGVPMFFTGDYNTGINQTGNDKFADGWENIVGGTKLVTSYTQTEDIGRFFGMDIDHICLNPELTEVMRWRKLDYRLIYDISDHLPVFTDVRLKS